MKDDSEYNYSISRYELNKFLMGAAAELGTDIKFDHALSETSDFSTPGPVGCVLHFTHGPPNKPAEQKQVRVKVGCPVIACDGAGSRARYAMRHAGLTTFSENLLDKGYKEVLFPKPEGDGFGSTGSDGGEPCPGGLGLHIWPRGDHMLMALANIDGSFTGTIYMKSKGAEDTFEALEDKGGDAKKCEAFCEKYYADALPHVGGMDKLVGQIRDNPNGLLGTVFVDTWAAQGKILLIGDASHAMVPFFGQGCNCGFEDVYWLSRLLDEHCGDGKAGAQSFVSCFKALEEVRKPNADAICNMALENFVEMRDKTADRKFQAMKRVENMLENKAAINPEGRKFRSRYAMVCYGGAGNVSYANAYDLGPVTWEILEELCSHMDGDEATGNIRNDVETQAQIDMVDWTLASKLVDEKLVPELEKLGMDLTTVKH